MTEKNLRVLILFILSNVLWGIAFFSPFLPMKIHEKIIVGVLCATIGEIAFWIFVWVAEKEVALKYRQYFSFKYYKNKFLKR